MSNQSILERMNSTCKRHRAGDLGVKGLIATLDAHAQALEGISTVARNGLRDLLNKLEMLDRVENYDPMSPACQRILERLERWIEDLSLT